MTDTVQCRGEGDRFDAGEFRTLSGYVIHWAAAPQHTIDGEPWPIPDLPTADAEPIGDADIESLEERWRADDVQG